MPQPKTTKKSITIYICPTPGCNDFTAAPADGTRLEDSWTGPKVEDRGAREKEQGSPFTHNRAECPTCRTYRRTEEGDPLRVQRIRLRIGVNVPVEGPPTPPLPPSVAAAMDRVGA